MLLSAAIRTRILCYFTRFSATHNYERENHRNRLFFLRGWRSEEVNTLSITEPLHSVNGSHPLQFFIFTCLENLHLHLVMLYPQVYNASYTLSPQELLFINTRASQLGPPLIGLSLASILQGILFIQYFEYLDGTNDVKTWGKWFVHSAFYLCSLKFAYIFCIGWDRFVTHYGDWAYISMFDQLSVPLVISNVLPNSACQLFFIHRYWIFSRNILFTFATVATLLATVIAGIVMTYAASLVAGGDLYVSRLIFISTLCYLTAGLLCNIFITSLVCYHLMKEKTGYARTDNLVKSVIRISLESVAGPTILSLIGLLLVRFSNDNQWFLVPAFVSSHIYGCSLFYSVNARKRLSHFMGTTITTTLDSGSGPPARHNEDRIARHPALEQSVMSSVQFRSQLSESILVS